MSAKPFALLMNAHAEALLRRLQAHDRHAQSEVFRRYRGPVRRVLVDLLGTDADAKDALQETFVKVFREVEQVQDPLALRAWVLSVARSVGLDEARRRRRRQVERLARYDPDTRPSVASAEIRSALWDVGRVLSVLPDRERRVFVLRRVDGLELVKIAQECDVSLATVKRRLVRASNRFTALARRKPGLRDWVPAARRAPRVSD